MQDTPSNNKRIAKNTLFLYTRSLVTMAIGLYTSRVVLQTLGIDDYGIYNVVGGFVAMFSVLSSSLVNASQRFISFEMGKSSPQMKRIFCGTVSIHILMAICVFVVFESFGIWFLNSKLNIATERLYAANWIFQCSVLTFCINLVSVPYNACIIAHERMNVFAYIGIYEALAKLGIVYLLWISNNDKLIVYGLLMLAIAASLRLIYGFYCKRNFAECHFHFVLDKPLFREMVSFSGWNFIGSTAGILSTQGINVLVNLFFGVALNAARGVAEQVNSAVNTFVINFMTAINPQITKSFAAGKFEYMNKLMIRGAKYGALLFWLISLPLFVEANFILGIWLIQVPPYAATFLRLVIIYSIFQALSNTLYIGMLATGHIKKYQIIMGLLSSSSFLLCYLFFTWGLGPEWSYISILISVFLCVFARLWLMEDMVPDFSWNLFLNDAIVKSFMVIVFSIAIVLGIKYIVGAHEWTGLILTTVSSFIIVPSLSYFVAFDKRERNLLTGKVLGYLVEHTNK